MYALLLMGRGNGDGECMCVYVIFTSPWRERGNDDGLVPINCRAKSALLWRRGSAAWCAAWPHQSLYPKALRFSSAHSTDGSCNHRGGIIIINAGVPGTSTPRTHTPSSCTCACIRELEMMLHTNKTDAIQRTRNGVWESRLQMMVFRARCNIL